MKKAPTCKKVYRSTIWYLLFTIGLVHYNIASYLDDLYTMLNHDFKMLIYRK